MSNFYTSNLPASAPNILSIWRSTFVALRAIPSLRKTLLHMALAGSLIFIALMALLLFLFDAVVYEQFIGKYADGEGWLSILSEIGRWLGFIVVGAFGVVVNLRLVIIVLAFWNDILVGKIVNHFRALASPPFAWSRFWSEQKRTIVLLLRDIAIMLVVLLIGLISVVGYPLVLIAECILAGAAIRSAYLTVLQGTGMDIIALRKKLRPSVPQLGILPVLFSLVPFVGWLLIPALVVLQQVGFVWAVESKIQQQSNQSNAFGR